MLCLVASAILAGSTGADRGGIPLDPTVQFDERAQNAIVAWNGQKECLILSTDLQSPAPGRLMEMLPLPAAPYDIQLGNTSSFQTLIRLFNEKSERLRVDSPKKTNEARGMSGDGGEEYRGIEVVFSKSIGLHNITVVKIESPDHFVQWARDFAGAHGASNLSISEDLNRTVGDHLARNISYFVFDIVDLTVELETSQPMVYLFNTSYLYYPLKITFETLDERMAGFHKINIFLITDGVLGSGVHEFTGVHAGAGIDEFIEFTRTELRSVSGPMAGLFNRSAFATHYFGTIYGARYHPDHIDDIVVKPEDIRRPSDAELRAQYERADFLNAIEPLSPSFGYYLLRGIYGSDYAMSGNALVFALLGLFLTPVTFGVMFKSIIERGKRRSSLWIAWFIIFCIGVIGAAGFTLLVSLQSDIEIGAVFSLVALALPLAVVTYLGKRYERKPATGKWTVPVISYGMGVLVTITVVFAPGSMIGSVLAGLCFPLMGILGIVMVIGIIVARIWRLAPSS